MITKLWLNLVSGFADIGHQLLKIHANAVFDHLSSGLDTVCYFHRNRRLPIRRRPEFPMRLTRDWSRLSTSAIYSTTHKCSALICPVHTPIRRRREGWRGESVGHVASPKDTYYYCVVLYCIHLTQDYMERTKIEDTHKFPGQATPWTKSI